MRITIIMVFPQWILPVNQLDGETIRRCETALEKYHRLKESNGPCKLMVMGGFFHSRDVQTTPAAVLLKRWFVAKGVLEEDIVGETRSVDTFENIWNGLDTFARVYGADVLVQARILVVSEAHHVRRIRWTLRMGYGLRSEAAAHSQDLRGKDALREWAYYIVHLFTHPISLLGFLSAYSRRKRHLLVSGGR